MPLTPGPRTKRVRRTPRPAPVNPNVSVYIPAKTAKKKRKTSKKLKEPR